MFKPQTHHLNSQWSSWSSRGSWTVDAEKRPWQLRKEWAELSIIPPMKAHMREIEKRKCMERKKPERTAVFFQGFSRKKVDIFTRQKMKHHFLEWAKCHINRWQKCRHAREQDYELMHGHVFLSRYVETAALWELFQLLNLQNHVSISLASSLLQMDIDVISWKTFFSFSYFDNHSNISHTNVYLNEREVVVCCYINIFDFYYFKVSVSKHHTLSFYLYGGLFYLCINKFALIFKAFWSPALFKTHHNLSICVWL